MRPLSTSITIVAMLAILASLLPPPVPVHAAETIHTWDTQADFEAGVLSNVDTATSPGDVLQVNNLDTGNGSFGNNIVNAIQYTDDRRSAVNQRSNTGTNVVYIADSTGFDSSHEVIIIQMTGTNAGIWETKFIQSVSPGQITLTQNLTNTYYADASNKAQVIVIPQYKEVEVWKGGKITCHSWDGSTGGIVIFRAQGTVYLGPDGEIDVSGTGFMGGTWGAGGSGGKGGDYGKGGKSYKHGSDANLSGTGGKGGSAACKCGKGGDGSLQGYMGNIGDPGNTGDGAGGGASGQGGLNDSSDDLSLLQLGSGGGGGSGGRGGYGGGGGGGGGGGDIGTGSNGGPGGKGGDGGHGGNGGQAAGAVIIFAKTISLNGHISANGWGGSAGIEAKDGHDSSWERDQSEGGQGSVVCSGSAGGGGGGSQGGYGGNGGGGGSGGTVWLAAENITLGNSLVTATGGTGAAGGPGISAGGKGQSGNIGGYMEAPWCAGNDSDDGPQGPNGPAGSTGGNGGQGVIRLDYFTASGDTNPGPLYRSGLYSPSGTIASNVVNTGVAAQHWAMLDWNETLHSNTDISFEVRASDTAFSKEDTAIPWITVGDTRPVTSGLPSGQYIQWRATLTSNRFNTPSLHNVSVAYGNEPVVYTRPATNVTIDSATLNGNLNYLGKSGGVVTVSFQLATTPGGPYDIVFSQDMNATGDFRVNLSSFTPNTTYYYRARVYSSTDGTAYGQEMNFHTSMMCTITTNSAGNISVNWATLNGSLTNMGSSATVDVSFEWGTTSGGPYSNSTPSQAMTSTGAFYYKLTGLSVNTKYYFRAKGKTTTGNCSYGAEMNFTTSNHPPSVATDDAQSVTASSATLDGNLTDLGSASAVNVSFEWGTSQGGPYPNTTPAQSKTSTGPFTAALSGLNAKTTYYFRAIGTGSSGTSRGSEASFTTTSVKPSVVTVGATNISTTSATLNGDLTSLGSATNVSVEFIWGVASEQKRNATGFQTLTANVSFQYTITGLTPDTEYRFQAYACGDSCTEGNYLTFTTPKDLPVVSTNDAANITVSSATLNGTLHSLGSASSVAVSFQYGVKSGMYSDETTPQLLSAPADFQAFLNSLAAGTTYYYRAKADGDIHGIGYGTEHIFTTGHTPPSVTTDAASNLTTDAATLNGNLDSLGTADTINVSFRWGDTKGGPYPNLTVPQALKAAGAFQARLTGLSSATTYYYQAKADGGISGTDYGAEASFFTGSFPPYIETQPATGTTDTASTLNGNLRLMGSAPSVNVNFQYGTTKGGPYLISTPLQSMKGQGNFNAGLTGLAAGVTYYFITKADGGIYGSSTGNEMVFTTGKIPPSETTTSASEITSDNATLNGSLDSLGDASAVNVAFQWGTIQGGPYAYTTTPQAMASTGAFNYKLTGLTGNKTYYYRARGDGGKYGTSYGSELNFTTLKSPPSVDTDNATNVGAVSATLNGYLDSMGTASSVNTCFRYGTTQGGPYSYSTPLQSTDSRCFLQSAVSGLSALTTYYFVAYADGGEHGTASGDERSFTTTSTPASVDTGGVTSVSADAATLNGTLNSLGTAATVNVSFQYGTSAGLYSEETPQQFMNSKGDFLANLSGLHSHTTYYYRAKADGGSHGVSYGSEHSFTTGSLPPSVTTGDATHKTTNTAQLNGNLDSLGTATGVNLSFIYGTTAGGPYTGSTAPQAMTSTGVSHAYVTGLSPFTTYYYRARADGGVYGAAYGNEFNFTTNHLEPIMWTGDALDVMTSAATLEGNLILPGSASTVSASFEWGTARGGPYPNSTSTQVLTKPQAFRAHVNGLTSGTTYYFRSKGDGGIDGTGYGSEQVFTTGSNPPSVATSDASGITNNSAVLNGNLSALGAASSVNVSFEWGTTQGGPYTNSTTVQSMTTKGAFNSTLSGLTPCMAYYFRARADGGIYGTSHGDEKSFLTPASQPAVTTNGAASVTSSSANLCGSLTYLGRATTVNVYFRWGTTRGGPYPNTTPRISRTTPASFITGISGLSSHSSYYYTAVADGGAYGITYGQEQGFTTAEVVPEVVQKPTGIYTSPPKASVQAPSTVVQPRPVALSNISVQEASLSSSSVMPGDMIIVNALVTNRGQSDGVSVIRVYVNGEVESVQGVTISNGKSKEVSFTICRNEPGEYNVHVNSVPAGSFCVFGINPDIILWISIALIISSLVLGVSYLRKRRA